MKANYRRVMKRMNQLEARVGPGPGPIPEGASVYVSPVTPVGSASVGPALQLAQLRVEKAANELEQADVEVVMLREAHDLLTGPLPLTPQRAATAYLKAREVRKDCPPKLEELGKDTALVVREVLVLLICCGATEQMSNVAFEYFLEQAFDMELGPELRSQLHLGRSAICRMGRDRITFERKAAKIFGKDATPEQLSQLWPAHADCEAIGVTKKAKHKTKPRHKSRDRHDLHESHDSSTSAASAEEVQLVERRAQRAKSESLPILTLHQLQQAWQLQHQEMQQLQQARQLQHQEWQQLQQQHAWCLHALQGPPGFEPLPLQQLQLQQAWQWQQHQEDQETTSDQECHGWCQNQNESCPPQKGWKTGDLFIPALKPRI